MFNIKKEIKNVIIESKADQIQLAIKAKAGDIRSQQTLVMSMMPYILSCSNYYGKMSKKPGISADDLIGEGTQGAYKAIEKFDPTQNVKFSTFSEWHIRASIQDAIRINQDQGSEINHVSTSMKLDADSDMSIIDVIIDESNATNSTYSDDIEYLRSLIDNSKKLLTTHEQLTIDTIMTGDYDTIQEVGEAIGIRKQAVSIQKMKAISKIRIANQISSEVFA